MGSLTALIKFYGGCVEEVRIFDDDEKLAAAFEEATGASFDDYMNGSYEPDLEHGYVECHGVENELGRTGREQVVAQLVSVAQSHIPALEDRGDLEARDNDHEDFFETSVWSLKAALMAAYDLGRSEALTVDNRQAEEKSGSRDGSRNRECGSLDYKIQAAETRKAGSASEKQACNDLSL